MAELGIFTWWSRHFIKSARCGPIFSEYNDAMTNSHTKSKRPSSVVSSQTYRNMVCQVLEQAPTKALDLHGIYDALGTLYDQYKEDSIEVDWKVNPSRNWNYNITFI